MDDSSPAPTDPRPELHARILRRTALLRRVQLALGRDLAEMHRSCAFLLHGATSFPLYCETFGLAGVEGLQLEAVDRGEEAAPGLAAQVARGETSLPAAASLARLLRDPTLRREGDEWLRWAAEDSTREFLDRVKRRRDEARAASGVWPLRAYLTIRGAAAFQRARELSMRGAGRTLSEGQTVEAVAEDFLERHDAERRARRMEARDAERDGVEEARAARPRSRHVPAAERRAVIREGGDRCRVAGCANGAFLDFCHREPWSEGGSNEASNLWRFCRMHHRQFDAGEWRTVEGRGGTLLVDRRGSVVGRLRAAEPSPSPPPGGAPASAPAPGPPSCPTAGGSPSRP